MNHSISHFEKQVVDLVGFPMDLGAGRRFASLNLLGDPSGALSFFRLVFSVSGSESVSGSK